MVDRMALSDDHAGDFVIPRGSTVVVFVYGAHHSPRYWENPESFDPERFSKANEKLHTPFAYLPFGAGPRGCIGGNYAMLQILMILSVLLRKYDLRLTPGQTIEARPMVILRPKHGIRMTFTEGSCAMSASDHLWQESIDKAACCTDPIAAHASPAGVRIPRRPR